jgi:chromosome segregation ATPase
LNLWGFKFGDRRERAAMGPRAMDLNESFQQLEQKLLKASEVFKRAVAEKQDLEKAYEKLKHDTGDSRKSLEALQDEIKVLRREREEVRVRVEKLLSQIDQLTGSGSEG